MPVMYPVIKSHILEMIYTNQYSENTKLPTEREFTDQFNVSRMTVRRAFDELIEEGVLIRRKGSGVFVAFEKERRSAQKMCFQSDQDLLAKYGKNKTKILKMAVVKNHPLATKLLNVDKDQEVYHIKRIQYGNKTPLVYENMFFSKEFYNNMENLDCKKLKGTLVSESKNYAEVTRRLVEFDATLATKKDVTYLELQKVSPVLQITNIEYVGDKVAHVEVSRVAGNLFKFYAELNDENILP